MSAEPNTAARLTELLGKRKAQALCRAAGGQNVYIPLTFRDTKTLRMLGRDDVARLQVLWAGQEIRIPTLAAMTRAERNETIRRLAAGGASRVEIARRVRLSPRQVSNVLRAA